jgi:hypothetical protein
MITNLSTPTASKKLAKSLKDFDYMTQLIKLDHPCLELVNQIHTGMTTGGITSRSQHCSLRHYYEIFVGVVLPSTFSGVIKGEPLHLANKEKMTLHVFPATWMILTGCITMLWGDRRHHRLPRYSQCIPQTSSMTYLIFDPRIGASVLVQRDPQASTRVRDIYKSAAFAQILLPRLGSAIATSFREVSF